MTLILSDYPDKSNEDKPLGDSHGRYFWHLMYEAGINVRDMEIVYLWDSYKDYLYHAEESKAKLSKIKKNKEIKEIVPLGKSVCRALGITESVDKIRGSVLQWNGKYVVPTFHPRNLKSPYRMFSEEPMLKGFYTAKDLDKVARISRGNWVTPEERFNLSPTLDEWKDFVDTVLREDSLLGTDIEATGLNLEYAQLVVIGFATSESDCIVYPFTDYGGEPYWPDHEKDEADIYLRRLLSKGRLLFQNGVGYDVPLLKFRGYDVPLDRYQHDTMIMHHALDPELPHNIGFINSLYGKMPYWKDGFLTRKEHIHYTDQLEMRTYNARDCINLHQIMPPMVEELEERGLNHIYKRGMDVSRPVIKMQQTGMLLDKGRYTSWKKYVADELYIAEEAIKDAKELPEEFNLKSPEHKRWLLYREPIPKAEKVAKLLAEHNLLYHNYQYKCETCHKVTRTVRLREDDEVPRYDVLKCNKCGKKSRFKRTDKQRTTLKQKSKTSKVYKDMEKVSIVMSVIPFSRVRGYSPLKTDKGFSALDKKELERMLLAINKRLEEIENLKRKADRHIEEEKDLLQLRSFNIALQRFGKLAKLEEAFTDFPVWQDGRVRPSLLVTGTSTGRFSCKKPNLQQIPSDEEVGNIVRACFKAPKGYRLLSVDFSNLEVHIAARVMRDPVLLKDLNEGNNYHDVNTRAFFGISDDDPSWKKLRKVAKMLGFARLLYGGSDEGIYGKVLVEDPSFDMSLGQFKDSIQAYMDSHPAYVTWVEDTVATALEIRTTSNASGRTRRLYGSKSAISRQALNTPVQGSAADEVIDDLILLDEALLEYASEVVMQIHDELLFYIKESELSAVYPIIAGIMNREREINGIKFRIPIDAELGIHWGELHEFDPETFEYLGESKH